MVWYATIPCQSNPDHTDKARAIALGREGEGEGQREGEGEGEREVEKKRKREGAERGKERERKRTFKPSSSLGSKPHETRSPPLILFSNFLNDVDQQFANFA